MCGMYTAQPLRRDRYGPALGWRPSQPRMRAAYPPVSPPPRPYPTTGFEPCSGHRANLDRVRRISRATGLELDGSVWLGDETCEEQLSIHKLGLWAGGKGRLAVGRGRGARGAMPRGKKPTAKGKPQGRGVRGDETHQMSVRVGKGGSAHLASNRRPAVAIESRKESALAINSRLQHEEQPGVMLEAGLHA